MRVAVIVVAMLVVATPSEASPSCMSKTAARQHFGSVHIWWHGQDHCWDATPGRRHQIHGVRIHGVRRSTLTREVQRKPDQPTLDQSKSDQPRSEPSKLEQFKWRDSMSEMLADAAQSPAAPADARQDRNDAAATPGSDRGVNTELSPLVSRWVDIAPVAPPRVIERKPEPSGTPSLLSLVIVLVLILGTVTVLFRVTVYERLRSTSI